MTDRDDPVEARLTALLGAWRDDVTGVPMPPLVDPDRAVDVVLEALRRRHEPCPEPRPEPRPESTVRIELPDGVPEHHG